jgi:hypothetical protein
MTVTCIVIIMVICALRYHPDHHSQRYYRPHYHLYLDSTHKSLFSCSVHRFLEIFFVSHINQVCLL